MNIKKFLIEAENVLMKQTSFKLNYIFMQKNFHFKDKLIIEKNISMTIWVCHNNLFLQR